MGGRWRVLVLVVLSLGACTCPRVCAPCLDGPRGPSTTPALDVTLTRALAARPGEPVHVLSLSAGGQNGSFAAGVLHGWRKPGRPEFRVVVGVSIGALLSTFAFLGTPEADEVMRTGFAGLDHCDVFPPRAPLAVPLEGSAYKPDGIEAVIARHVTNDVIRQVAAASHNGARALLVGTTNLDTGLMHVWDMTQMARAGHYDQYRRVLLASSSVPIFLPPVELAGALHVDGAVTQQIFVPSLRAARAGAGNPDVTVHVIANGTLHMRRECVPKGIVDQGQRALIMFARTTLVDGLWRVWGMGQLEGLQVRMLAVPLDVAPTSFLGFEPEIVRRLYRRGVSLGEDPAAWMLTPPIQRIETSR